MWGKFPRMVRRKLLSLTSEKSFQFRKPDPSKSHGKGCFSPSPACICETLRNQTLPATLILLPVLAAKARMLSKGETPMNLCSVIIEMFIFTNAYWEAIARVYLFFKKKTELNLLLTVITGVKQPDTCQLKV